MYYFNYHPSYTNDADDTPSSAPAGEEELDEELDPDALGEEGEEFGEEVDPDLLLGEEEEEE